MVIKFKAWDWKQWRYGTYYYGCMYPTSFMGHYVDEVQIDETTLSQFTGLLDKNGKEIYANDICKDEDGETGAIMHHAGYFSFRGAIMGCDNLDQQNIQIEVIGNIYPKPEL